MLNNIYLFSNNKSNYSSIKLYYLKIYDNNNLIRDYIPCIRKSDSEVGLYSLVDNEFYKNEETENFIKGVKSQLFEYGINQKLDLNVYERYGYSFTGWNTNADGSGKSYYNNQEVLNLGTDNNEEISLYAQWKGNDYEVSFESNGGSVSVTSKSVVYGSKYGELPVPTKVGYTFVGWYTEIELVNKIDNTSVVNIPSNHTLYAKWEQIK